MLMNASNMLAASDPLDHVVQHKIFSIPFGSYEFIFTNHMFMMLVAAIIRL